MEAARQRGLDPCPRVPERREEARGRERTLRSEQDGKDTSESKPNDGKLRLLFGRCPGTNTPVPCKLKLDRNWRCREACESELALVRWRVVAGKRKSCLRFLG